MYCLCDDTTKISGHFCYPKSVNLVKCRCFFLLIIVEFVLSVDTTENNFQRLVGFELCKIYNATLVLLDLILCQLSVTDDFFDRKLHCDITEFDSWHFMKKSLYFTNKMREKKMETFYMQT